MKRLLILLTLSFSLSSFAWNDQYKFDHFKRVDDFDYQQAVLDNEGWSIVIFNRGYCTTSHSMMDCFPYEMKLNSLAPKIFARNNNIQIINMDTESTYTHQHYNISALPAVVFILNGQIMKTLQANRCNPYRNRNSDYRRLNWANDLLQRTLDEIYKIPVSMDQTKE